jgi:peptidoglycan/xylan/chitin deacetylase (PgdA/CDA1 family)
MPLYLLVGIDTEGDNQWDSSARAHQTFENIYALPALHDLFARTGIRPTYFITFPVARDDRSAAVLRELLARGDCEIGAHHHAWETPPFDPADIQRHPYALSLPARQFREQLDALTRAIEAAVGRRPVSYRSGRFGLSASHVSPLEQAGYRVESTVSPLFNESHKGGPDFVGAGLTPYFLAYDDVRTAGSSDVVELPVSAGLNRVVPRWLERMYARAPRQYFTRRVLRRLGIARVLWLRPSYSSLDDMQRLARRVKARGVPILNVIFHSSEAIVGGSPYNRTQEELAAFLERLERFLTFAVTDLGAKPLTFREYRATF